LLLHGASRLRAEQTQEWTALAMRRRHGENHAETRRPGFGAGLYGGHSILAPWKGNLGHCIRSGEWCRVPCVERRDREHSARARFEIASREDNFLNNRQCIEFFAVPLKCRVVAISEIRLSISDFGFFDRIEISI
jgi:hypothetical protein